MVVCIFMAVSSSVGAEGGYSRKDKWGQDV